MAEHFCDHGAYASALGTTPTWGVPQEGDGSSKDAATASAIASVVFASVPTTGAISMCGASISTSGVIGAANVNAAANALATNINATTAAVSSAAAAGTPQLRNLVFARGPAGGAPAGTCQIMTRIGSATLNHAANANVAIAQTLSPAATLSQLAGGSGGCWGWLINPAAMGVASSIAVVAYGALVTNPYASASADAPSVSALPTGADVIYVRTGAGQTITLPVTQGIGAGQTFSHRIVFDTNTKWTGDSGLGEITIGISTGGGDVAVRLASNTSGLRRVVQAIKRGGLRIHYTAGPAFSGNAQLRLYSASGNVSPALWQGVAFSDVRGAGAAVGASFRFEAGGVFNVRLVDCDYLDQTARSSMTAPLGGTINDGCVAEFDGCSFTFNNTSGADPGPWWSGTIGPRSAIRLRGCSLGGWAFGKHRVFGPSSVSDAAELSAIGCTGINLGTSYVNLQNGGLAQSGTATYSAITSAEPGQGYRYEYRNGVVDWNPEAAPAYPTLRALQQDGATKWSIKLDWFSTNNVVNPAAPLTTPRLTAINRLATAARTVRVDFLSPQALNSFQVVLRVQYVDSGNVVRSESTVGQATALAASGDTWDGAASYPSHVAYRLQLTSSAAIKQGTELAAWLEMTDSPPGGSGIQVFVDPEVAIS